MCSCLKQGLPTPTEFSTHSSSSVAYPLKRNDPSYSVHKIMRKFGDWSRYASLFCIFLLLCVILPKPENSKLFVSFYSYIASSSWRLHLDIFSYRMAEGFHAIEYGFYFQLLYWNHSVMQMWMYQVVLLYLPPPLFFPLILKEANFLN